MPRPEFDNGCLVVKCPKMAEQVKMMDKNLIKALGIDIKDIDSIDFDKLVGMQFKLINNNDYYEKTNFNSISV